MTPSSTASSTCRIDWRPSRWLVAALIALGGLAALSLLLSALPLWPKLAASLLALLQGLRLAHREWIRPALSLAWAGGDAPAQLSNGQGTQALQAVRVRLRGPLAVLRGRDGQGRLHRLVWWPDTLPSSSRRLLRLAAGVSCRSDKPLPPVAA